MNIRLIIKKTRGGRPGYNLIKQVALGSLAHEVNVRKRELLASKKIYYVKILG